MARATKVYCMYCESKMAAGISHCPSCSRPTDWASYDERVAYEVQQWRSIRANGSENGNGSAKVSGSAKVGGSAKVSGSGKPGVHAPPPPRPRKRQTPSSTAAASSVERVGDLTVRREILPGTPHAHPTIASDPSAASTTSDPSAASSRSDKKGSKLFGRKKHHADEPQHAVAPDAPKATPPSAADPAVPAPPRPATSAPSSPAPSAVASSTGHAAPSDGLAASADGSWSRLLSRDDRPSREATPKKPAAVQKTPAKKPVARKASAKEPAATKAPAKKASAKKPSGTKAPAKKAPAKKTSAKKTSAKKALAKSPAVKRPANPEDAAGHNNGQSNAAGDTELMRETVEVLRGLGRQMGSLNDRISGIEKLLEPKPARRLFRRP